MNIYYIELILPLDPEKEYRPDYSDDFTSYEEDKSYD